jgi:DNA-binding transcriptional regulator YiaG
MSRHAALRAVDFVETRLMPESEHLVIRDIEKIEPSKLAREHAPIRRPRRPFWENVDRSDPEGCWPWLGYCGPSGHGLTSHRGLPIHASRKAWILTHGEIRGELSVLHKCDNPPCCNPGPKHLYLGTRAEGLSERRRVRAIARQSSSVAIVLTSERSEEPREIPNRVPVARELYGINVKEIAAVCKVTERTARRWKDGARSPPESALMVLRRDLRCFSDYWRGWTINGEDIVSPEGWCIDRNQAMTVPLMHGQISALREKIAGLEKALAAAGGARDTDWEIEISVGPPGQKRLLRAALRDINDAVLLPKKVSS